MGWRLWTDAEDEQLAAMYAGGLHTREIGKALDRSANAVSGRASVLGLSRERIVAPRDAAPAASDANSPRPTSASKYAEMNTGFVAAMFAAGYGCLYTGEHAA
jgi:hypothetical protein